MAGPRWRKMLHRTLGHDLFIAVQDWQDVLAAGSTTGTPLKQAVFKNTWKIDTAIDTVTTTGHVVQYYKDPFGVVHMRGTAKRNTSRPNITAGEVILTLPDGYRPNQLLRLYTVNNNTANAVTVPLYIKPNGDITVQAANEGTQPYNMYWVAQGAAGTADDGYLSDVGLSFDGVHFRAEELKS